MCCVCSGGLCNHIGPCSFCPAHSGQYTLTIPPVNIPYQPYQHNYYQVYRDYGAEIDALKLRIEELERKLAKRGKTKTATIQL